MRFARGLLAFLYVMASSVPALAQGPQVLLTYTGGIGDGKTLNTRVIQFAIDHAAARGGTIVFPPGVFLSGAIFLKPGVNLELQKGAVLKGSTDVSDYPICPTRIEGHIQNWLPALINADHADHLSISGQGIIDGSGQPFWAEFRERRRANRITTNMDVPRPRLVFIENSSDVHIDGIHLTDSAFWNLHLYRCRDCVLENLNISAAGVGTTLGAPSTDGMDIDSSQNITIRRCTFSVDDDCIALKGTKGPQALLDKTSPPVTHVRISDCTFLQGGGVTCGSEATIVRDVRVEHCTFEGDRGMYMARFKLRPDTPQDYEDIVFNDITLDGAGRFISIEPWRQYFDLHGQAPPTSTVRNVTLSNIHGTFGVFGAIVPNEGDTIDKINFQNIDLNLDRAEPTIRGDVDLHFNKVVINGESYAGPG